MSDRASELGARAGPVGYKVSAMGFITPSYDLVDLFKRIDRGDIQVPDFQQDYAWDEDHIRSLLVTVLRGYPIGAVTVLDTRDEKMRFKPRPLAGAPAAKGNPGMLLLDGEQRMTTLYHCLRGSGNIRTTDYRGATVMRRYFLDVKRAVSEELLPDEAVFAVDDDNNVYSHFGPALDYPLDGQEAYLRSGCVPVSLLLSEEGTGIILSMAAHAHAGAVGPDKILEQSQGNSQSQNLEYKELAEFHNRVLFPLAGYDVPMIRLSRETASAGVGTIFAHANSSGQDMDVFDLVTAVFASEDENFRLADDWAKREKALRKYPALDGIGRTQFLSAVSLYTTADSGHAGGQREDILTLTLDGYLKAADKLQITFQEVAEFLRQRCIFSVEQVPYTAQIIPLAVILARLAHVPGCLSSEQAWDKINRWFWSGVFGELYGSEAVKLRAARDVEEVSDWVLGNREDEPKSVREAEFEESRLNTAGVSSGIYHALYALLMARGARDWRSAKTFDKNTFFELSTGFHQIFPDAWCEKFEIDDELAKSVLNHTPMGKRTEVVIDGHSPARYLSRVQSKSILEDAEFDTVLASHELNPELLLQADFDGFIRDRRERFIGMIEHAMGKPAIRSTRNSATA